MTAERKAVDLMRAAWRATDPRTIRKGWPKGGPTVSRGLADHLSHFMTADGVVYRAEPYGPFTAEEIGELAGLLDKWHVEINPRGSTHFPGSTMQVMYRRRQ